MSMGVRVCIISQTKVQTPTINKGCEIREKREHIIVRAISYNAPVTSCSNTPGSCWLEQRTENPCVKFVTIPGKP
jgi:hypothetical protein